MPDAPDVPVAAVIDAGSLTAWPRMQGEARKALLREAEETNPKPPPNQWKTRPERRRGRVQVRR